MFAYGTMVVISRLRVNIIIFYLTHCNMLNKKYQVHNYTLNRYLCMCTNINQIDLVYRSCYMYVQVSAHTSVMHFVNPCYASLS